MSITNAIGGLLGGSPNTLANQTMTTLQSPGNMIGNYAGYDIREIERAMAQQKERNMIESGDLIVRKVRNGYRILVSRGAGSQMDEYVAKELDEVIDVMKLAGVNVRLDAAK